MASVYGACEMGVTVSIYRSHFAGFSLIDPVAGV